jgi:hypothetical protein
MGIPIPMQKAGTAEAQQFLMAFPLQKPPAAPTVVGVIAFDNWAERCGYYTTKCEPATRSSNRMVLRSKINSAAGSMEWVGTGHEPFHIRVGAHGDHYLVEPALDAYHAKTSQLPSRVTSLARTKRKLTSKLLITVDRTQLSLDENDRIDEIENQIECALKTVNFVLDLANGQIARSLARLAKTIPSLPKRPRLSSQLDIDSDGDGSPFDPV